MSRKRQRNEHKKRGFARLVESLVFLGAIAGVYCALLHPELMLENRDRIITGLIVAGCILIIIPILAGYIKKRRYLKSPLSKIDVMSGTEFEEYLKARFEHMGYKVLLTPATNDYGADLILNKKGEVTVVQAKRYNGNVGNKAVQEVVAAQAYYDADHAMVITNSYYTDNAINLAEVNNVELWDRDNLISNTGFNRAVHPNPQIREVRSKKTPPIEDLKRIVEKLRSKEGCPWDAAQTHSSLKPECIEEAAEVICGINILEETGDPENLREELGDLLLQVVFHSVIAEEEGLFTLDDVIKTVSDKMIRRHPHVFDGVVYESDSERHKAWEEIKAREKEGREWQREYLRLAMNEAGSLLEKAKERKGFE